MFIGLAFLFISFLSHIRITISVFNNVKEAMCKIVTNAI